MQRRLYSRVHGRLGGSHQDARWQCGVSVAVRMVVLVVDLVSARFVDKGARNVAMTQVTCCSTVLVALGALGVVVVMMRHVVW